MKFQLPFKKENRTERVTVNFARRQKSEHLTGLLQAYGVLSTFVLGLAAGKAPPQAAFILGGMACLGAIFTALWSFEARRVPRVEQPVGSD